MEGNIFGQNIYSFALSCHMLLCSLIINIGINLIGIKIYIHGCHYIDF